MKNININLPMIVLFSATSDRHRFHFRKDHDTIRVKNLETSVKFYENILGLEQISNGGLGDHIKWFQLNNKVQLHLVESEEGVEKNKGVHTAFNIDKLSEFMEFLRSKSIPFENWKGEKNTITNRPDGVKQIYFQDPDGYWIEVNDSNV